MLAPDELWICRYMPDNVPLELTPLVDGVTSYLNLGPSVDCCVLLKLPYYY